jgi:hypothetical protein
MASYPRRLYPSSTPLCATQFQKSDFDSLSLRPKTLFEIFRISEDNWIFLYHDFVSHCDDGARVFSVLSVYFWPPACLIVQSRPTRRLRTCEISQSNLHTEYIHVWIFKSCGTSEHLRTSRGLKCLHLQVQAHRLDFTSRKIVKASNKTRTFTNFILRNKNSQLHVPGNLWHQTNWVCHLIWRWNYQSSSLLQP